MEVTTDWRQQAIELSKFVKQDGKKLSRRQIARILEVPKTTLQEFLKKHDESIVLEQDFSRILVISDMHTPFQHPKTLEFLAALKLRYSPTFVVCVGMKLIRRVCHTMRKTHHFLVRKMS